MAFDFQVIVLLRIEFISVNCINKDHFKASLYVCSIVCILIIMFLEEYCSNVSRYFMNISLQEEVTDLSNGRMHLSSAVR